MSRPLILVSNDDGYQAGGVNTLVRHLSRLGDVVMVCPDSPRSGQSMAITVNTPLRLTSLPDIDGAKAYKTNGTPVDCIKLAMHTVCAHRRPNLIVSGINHGSNAAVNVVYSGTMGAAFEGCAFGIPSVAFSLTTHDHDADFSPCMPFVDAICRRVLEKGLPDGVCLNVNIPAHCVPSRMRVVRAAKGKWSDEYKEYADPMGNPFYWLTGRFENEEPDACDTDEWSLAHGMVSVVPCKLDRTAPLISPDWISELDSLQF